MNGTWKTTGGGGGGLPWEFLVAIVAIGAAVGVAGAVETVTLEVLPWLLAAVAVIIVAAAAGLGWLLYRHAKGRPVHLVPKPVIIRPPERPQLPKAERPALEQHSHSHLHLHGVDMDAVADIITRRNKWDSSS